MLTLFGIGAFIFFYGGALKANARRWRYLAETYSARIKAPLETRNWQSAVLLGQGGYNALGGIISIGVTETGVIFRVMPPFSLLHSPLYIPFRDIRAERTQWYLNAQSVALQFRGAPEVRIVLPADQAEWMLSFSDRNLLLNSGSLPNESVGSGWRAFALLHAGMSVVFIAWLSMQLLSQ